MSAFTPTNECTLKDQLVSYLRSHILSSPLKTVEFCTEASRILNISRSDALDLSQELDFEDGKLYNVAILFNISQAGKPMRPLYMDAICQAITGHRDNVINSPCRERNSEKYAAVQGVVDAMVADLHKECSGGYALDSSVFIDVAIRHDLRRSEAWRLLEPMNFSEGLCVSAFSKWFDEEGNMRHVSTFVLVIFFIHLVRFPFIYSFEQPIHNKTVHNTNLFFIFILFLYLFCLSVILVYIGRCTYRIYHSWSCSCHGYWRSRRIITTSL